LSLALFAAVLTSLIDAILLHRKYQIFTGGFLSVAHLADPLETVGFGLTSIVADLGIIAPLVAIGLWLFSRLGLNARPSILTVLAIAITPVLVIDFINYQIHSYLGDAFDFALTFEIAGRNAREIYAVAATHLVAPIALLAANLAFVVFLIWMFKRYVPGWAPLPKAPGLARVGVEIAGVVLVSSIATGLAYSSSESLEQALSKKPSGGAVVAILERLTDIDGDGYGVMQRPRDPAPFDGQIFPFAVEIPGNGIDENGVGGDLPVDVRPQSNTMSPVATWNNRPDVIFILLESFRADLLGASYEGKAVTPVLTSLAQTGTSATAAYSHNGFTAPSRFHLFSGQLFKSNDDTTLIDDFKVNGYEVGYFSAQDAALGGRAFDVGFARADTFYDAQVEPDRRYTMFATPASIALPYKVIIEKVTAYLADRKSNRPLFLYVNFQDTHFPYHNRYVHNLISDAALPRSRIGPDRVDELKATYLNTAANVDMAVGEVLSAFKEATGNANPGIIVTSDHGESLYDDGYLGHGIALNDIQTQIPLIVVNLPVLIEKPFGQIQLRKAIGKSLSHEPGTEPAPHAVTSPSAAVFQYLGGLKRPRQIGLKSMSGRTIYDFRTGLFYASGTSWRRPEQLSETDARAFRSLIHHWEHLVLSTRLPSRHDG
jgi:glucan phosphoethanolaminetransferase (alkaline phosphatase superfamily)